MFGKLSRLRTVLGGATPAEIRVWFLKREGSLSGPNSLSSRLLSEMTAGGGERKLRRNGYDFSHAYRGEEGRGTGGYSSYWGSQKKVRGEGSIKAVLKKLKHPRRKKKQNGKKNSKFINEKGLKVPT